MMEELFLKQRSSQWLTGVRQIAVHACITLAAVAIAFSMPRAAQYILYRWWPKVAGDAGLLVATEIGLAAALVLFFNVSHIALRNFRKGRVADMASLVYVRDKGDRIGRLRERWLMKRLPAARDASILALTGFNAFASPESLLHEPLKHAYEVRVMLLNPHAHGAARRAESLTPAVTMQTYAEETDAAIGFLRELHLRGKKVTLKFYDEEPFLTVAVVGEHIWVQHCHAGVPILDQPEYVFALNREQPARGFFAPLYMYFLERWIDVRCPQYDFDTGELVCRDAGGRETERKAFLRERRDEWAVDTGRQERGNAEEAS